MINATQLQLQLKIYINELELELASGNITSCQKQLVQQELRNFRNHYAILTDLISIYESYGNRPEVPLTSDKQIEILQLLYKSDDGSYRNKRVYTVSVENIMSLLREYQNVFVKKDQDADIYDVSSNITIDDLDSFIIHFAIRDTSLSKILGISSIPIRYYNVIANELKTFFPNLDDRQFLIQALSQISTNPTLQFTNELDLIFSSPDPNGALAKLLWTGFHEYYSEKEMAHLRDESFMKKVESLEDTNTFINSEESFSKVKDEKPLNQKYDSKQKYITNRFTKNRQRNENIKIQRVKTRQKELVRQRDLRSMNRRLKDLNYQSFKTGLGNTSVTGIKEEFEEEFDTTTDFTFDDYNTRPSYYTTTLGLDNLAYDSDPDQIIDGQVAGTRIESNADQV